MCQAGIGDPRPRQVQLLQQREAGDEFQRRSEIAVASRFSCLSAAASFANASPASVARVNDRSSQVSCPNGARASGPSRGR